MSDTYADLGGGLTDPNQPPDCDARCDGMGLDRFAPIRTRRFIDCPNHTPATPIYARPGVRRRRGVKAPA